MSASKNGAGIKRLCWLDVARTEAIAISHRISDVFQVFGVFARTTKRILPSSHWEIVRCPVLRPLGVVPYLISLLGCCIASLVAK